MVELLLNLPFTQGVEQPQGQVLVEATLDHYVQGKPVGANAVKNPGAPPGAQVHLEGTWGLRAQNHKESGCELPRKGDSSFRVTKKNFEEKFRRLTRAPLSAQQVCRKLAIWRDVKLEWALGLFNPMDDPLKLDRDGLWSRAKVIEDHRLTKA